MCKIACDLQYQTRWRQIYKIPRIEREKR